VVTFRRFGKLRKLAICPIEISGIGNYTANTGSMATNPLGCRFDYNVGPMLNRTEKKTSGTECIINY